MCLIFFTRDTRCCLDQSWFTHWTKGSYTDHFQKQSICEKLDAYLVTRWFGSLGPNSPVTKWNIFTKWLLTNDSYFQFSFSQPSVLYSRSPSLLWHCWLDIRKSMRPVKTEWWGADVIFNLEQGANDLHICIWSSWWHCHPTISCFFKTQTGLIFLVPAYPGCPGKEAIKRESVCLFCTPGCVGSQWRWLEQTSYRLDALVCMYVSFGQGSSLLWTHTLRPVYSRPTVLTQEGRSLVNAVCERVRDLRVRRGE